MQTPTSSADVYRVEEIVRDPRAPVRYRLQSASSGKKLKRLVYRYEITPAEGHWWKHKRIIRVISTSKGRRADERIYHVLLDDNSTADIRSRDLDQYKQQFKD